MDKKSEQPVGPSEGTLNNNSKDSATDPKAVKPVVAANDNKDEPVTADTPVGSMSLLSKPEVPVTPEKKEIVTAPASSAPSSSVSAWKKMHWGHKLIGVAILVGALIIVWFINQPQKQSEPKNIGVNGLVTPTVTPVPTKEIIPFSDRNTWLIRLDNSFYSLKSLADKPEVGRKDVTGRTFSPLLPGEVFCRSGDQHENMYLEKNTGGVWARLCDKGLAKSPTKKFACERYDPDKGNKVWATFYPESDCSSEGTISAGYYRLHMTVYTGCETNADGSSEGKGCDGIVEVYSPQFEVQK